MITEIKEWLKYKLRRVVLESDKLTESVTKVVNPQQLKLEEKIDQLSLFGMAYWYEENFWEPPVQLALRDLCQYGDIVFDVGANFGGLTSVMSRMVGLKGIVCAFEASPRIVGKCQQNLILNGCNNVQLYHTAVYSESYQQIGIYSGKFLNDSIYNLDQSNDPAYQVNTIALDDFVAKTGLIPNLVKMDIEGAEFDAVKGMINTIKTAKPHLILETQPEDTRCLDLLRENGYIVIDLNSYREIKTPQDYPQEASLRNNLYIHSSKILNTIYQPPFNFQTISKLNPDDFEFNNYPNIELKQPFSLEKGRYLIDVNVTASGKDNDMMWEVWANDQLIFRYHAYSSLLAQSYHDWIINLERISLINIRFCFLNDTNDPTFSIDGATIVKITNFDNLKPQLFI
ncbi:FkbM family methyltransferase [Geminocystis sp. CENA526]|uniref:FkbM family methyltransferase n=1 Tax=Geminocystis sp. CENA526 TaxID=1355871 RepID=UPI003D6E89EF